MGAGRKTGMRDGGYLTCSGESMGSEIRMVEFKSNFTTSSMHGRFTWAIYLINPALYVSSSVK